MEADRKAGWKKMVLLFGMLCVAAVLIIMYRQNTGSKTGNTASYESGETSYSFAMGTSVSVSLYGAGEALYGTLEKQIQSLDTEVISWRQETSELATLNRSYCAGEAYPVSDTLYTALLQAENICRDSDGALDITIRPLASVWNIEAATQEDFEVPSEDAIRTALQDVGYEAVVCGTDQTVTIDANHRILDLGAVGKGFALDVVEQTLKEQSVPGAVISVGGSILVYGEKSDGSNFRVGIRDPEKPADSYIGYLEFAPGSNLCISTSGDYEKYIEAGGVRYHHILDRSTGYPADSGLSSVTVVCANGLYSDALSTACFVLGEEKSRALLEKYDAQAVFIDHAGNITITDGLKEQFYTE